MFFKDKSVNIIDDNITQAIDAGVMHLSPQETQSDSHTLNINGNNITNFSLHSYLGLETDPRVKQAIIDTTQHFGTTYSSSRANISAPHYKEFEDLLGQMFKSHVVVAPTTTLGSAAALPVLIQDNDLVIIDFFAHNSLVMPILAKSNAIMVRRLYHNDMAKLEHIIKHAQNNSEINHIWYIADGIYSTDGRVCDIGSINHLLNQYDNFYAYIDDAHGCSIVGEHGCGYILSHFKKQPEKLVVILGFCKAFGMGCGAAIVLPNKEWRRKITVCGPTNIFSGPIPTPMLGAGIALAKIHLTSEITALQAKLYGLVRYFKALLEQHGLSQFSQENPDFCPIIFIKIGATQKVTKIVQNLLAQGFFVNTFIYPAVPKNGGGLRISLNNHHTKEDLDALAKSLDTCFKRFNFN